MGGRPPRLSFVFAAWELGDVDGRAFGPDLRVWSVEDSVPFKL